MTVANKGANANACSLLSSEVALWILAGVDRTVGSYLHVLTNDTWGINYPF
jgi:hypothetical protein